MKKFEYRYEFNCSPLQEKYLNHLGSDGWELIGFMKDENSDYRYYLKREILQYMKVER